MDRSYRVLGSFFYFVYERLMKFLSPVSRILADNRTILTYHEAKAFYEPKGR